MHRTHPGVRILLLCAGGALAHAALGQGGGPGIHWGQDVPQAIEQARKSRLPLMFWVIGSSSDRAEAEDTERDQIRAFSHRDVVEQSRRFICCKMPKTRYKNELARWGLVNPNLDIVFVAPDGNKIDELNATAAKNPESLAQKMALVFRSFRQDIYDKDVKPVLQNPEASAKELRTALGKVGELGIVSADKDVLDLLKREGLDAGITAQCLDVLSKLATRPAVEELFARAANDKKADELLRKCPPIAAGYLLEHLGGADAARHVLAYDVICAVCKIKDAKKPAFWSGSNERIKNDEIKRVRKIAEQQAQRWRDRNEPYR